MSDLNKKKIPHIGVSYPIFKISLSPKESYLILKFENFSINLNDYL